MKIDIKKNTDYTIVTIKDHKLDATISSELKAELLILCQPPLQNLIIDLSQVDFCSSHGLRALLIANRQMRACGGKLSLVGVQPKVQSLLKISYLDTLAFTVFSTIAEATKKQ